MRFRKLCLLLLVVFSCEDKVIQEEIDTLDENILDRWTQNLYSIKELLYEIEELGSRPLDFLLWDDVQDLINLRKQYSIPEVFDSIDFDLRLEDALHYSQYLSQLALDKAIEIDENLIERVRLLYENQQITESIKKRLVLLNLLELENQFIENRAMRVGVNCFVMCPEFNYFRKSDSVRVGDYFESIVSLPRAGNSFEIFGLENIEVKFDSYLIPIDFKELSGSVYMKFQVDQVGEYIYTGDLEVTYDSIETNYECSFSYTIYGFE